MRCLRYTMLLQLWTFLHFMFLVRMAVDIILSKFYIQGVHVKKKNKTPHNKKTHSRKNCTDFWSNLDKLNTNGLV